VRKEDQALQATPKTHLTEEETLNLLVTKKNDIIFKPQ
jgi:hypothetical protein